jgi:L-fuculose-phosphate aldolase
MGWAVASAAQLGGPSFAEPAACFAPPDPIHPFAAGRLRRMGRDGELGASEAEIARLREAIVRAGRRMGSRGLIAAGEGNLSVGLGNGRLLVTPSGLRKDELDPDDLVIVENVAGGDSGPEERRPTSDLAIHRAIRERRPDVLAIAHAHGPATLALTLVVDRVDPADLPETALLLPRLPFVPFASPGSPQLAEAIAAALSEPPEPFPTAVLLERHGALAIGTAGDPVAALQQAVDRLELVEVLCRSTRDALLLRAARAAIR